MIGAALASAIARPRVCMSKSDHRCDNPVPANMQKWYIVGGLTVKNGQRVPVDDCKREPIISFGEDRMMAVLNSGITVYSEAEWKAMGNTCESVMQKREGHQ
jgi:hypothetical protein